MFKFLDLVIVEFHSNMSDEAMHSDASETSDMSEVSKISTASVRSTQSEKPRRKLRFKPKLFIFSTAENFQLCYAGHSVFVVVVIVLSAW